MDKVAPILFAGLLFVGGGFIVGKVLLGRPSNNSGATLGNPLGCPTSQPIKLTDEVKAYLDEQMKPAPPGSEKADVDPKELSASIADLETRVDSLLTFRSKSKLFMDKIVRFAKEQADWDNTRQDRLAKDRVDMGIFVLNDAVAKCGVKRWVDPKIIPYQIGKPATPPPAPVIPLPPAGAINESPVAAPPHSTPNP